MDSRSEPNPERMTLSLGSRETKELYEQFLSPGSISLARTFLRQNRKLLRRMEDQFHVEMEVVSAILLVESRFGENIGKYRVIPTLASMALTDSPENLRRNFQALNKMDPELSFEWLEVLSKRRADWAYQELKCFLRIILNERVDPLEVYGSHAGALGMPQFIPSSYLAYAVSKKNLESWLLNKEEAIFSIGNYLKSHGWKKKFSIDKKRSVLWRYNHSDPYVETILQIAQQIKKK
jgi:membrane-bound lytic murein transglycosylase B